MGVLRRFVTSAAFHRSQTAAVSRCRNADKGLAERPGESLAGVMIGSATTTRSGADRFSAALSAPAQGLQRRRRGHATSTQEAESGSSVFDNINLITARCGLTLLP